MSNTVIEYPGPFAPPISREVGDRPFTWQRFHILGFRERWIADPDPRRRGKWTLSGPKRFATDLRDAIYDRVPNMTTPKRLEGIPRWGACEYCGEPMPIYLGGACALCVAASEVVSRSKKEEKCDGVGICTA